MKEFVKQRNDNKVTVHLLRLIHPPMKHVQYMRENPDGYYPKEAIDWINIWTNNYAEIINFIIENRELPLIVENQNEVTIRNSELFTGECKKWHSIILNNEVINLPNAGKIQFIANFYSHLNCLVGERTIQKITNDFKDITSMTTENMEVVSSFYQSSTRQQQVVIDQNRELLTINNIIDISKKENQKSFILISGYFHTYKDVIDKCFSKVIEFNFVDLPSLKLKKEFQSQMDISHKARPVIDCKLLDQPFCSFFNNYVNKLNSESNSLVQHKQLSCASPVIDNKIDFSNASLTSVALVLAALGYFCCGRKNKNSPSTKQKSKEKINSKQSKNVPYRKKMN